MLRTQFTATTRCYSLDLVLIALINSSPRTSRFARLLPTMPKAAVVKVLVDADTNEEFPVLEWIDNPQNWTRGSMLSYMNHASNQQPNTTFLKKIMSWDDKTYEKACTAALDGLLHKMREDETLGKKGRLGSNAIALDTRAEVEGTLANTKRELFMPDHLSGNNKPAWYISGLLIGDNPQPKPKFRTFGSMIIKLAWSQHRKRQNTDAAKSRHSEPPTDPETPSRSRASSRAPSSRGKTSRRSSTATAPMKALQLGSDADMESVYGARTSSPPPKPDREDTTIFVSCIK